MLLNVAVNCKDFIVSVLDIMKQYEAVVEWLRQGIAEVLGQENGPPQWQHSDYNN